MVDRGEATEDGDDSAILIPFQEARRRHLEMPVTFDRRELDLILRVYGRMVAAGEWRDYAIDHRSGMAVFSVFRHSQERPLFAIAKCSGLQEPAADYLILSGRKRVATGASLDAVLGIFEERFRVVS